MKKNTSIIKVIVFAVLLVVLLQPGLNPFISAETRAATAAELQANFGLIAGGPAGLFSWARVTTIAAIVIFMWLATTIFCFIMEKLASGKKRSRTVAGMMSSVIKTLAVIATLVWVLKVLGVNLAGIFASLGIASLIIGFGAQSLIEDTITGIFIIFEGQYNIGDIIIVDDFRGTVVKINMRTTTIRDTGNNLKIINNSDIRNIQNRSKQLSWVVCDVGTSYDADIRDIEKVIEPALQGMYDRNKDVFAAVPQYAGVQSLADSSVVVRIMVEVHEEKFFPAQRRLNREVKILFDENNIEIPFNQLVVHNG